MRDLAARGGSNRRGLVIAVWLVLAAAGTVGVWRLSAYIESLTALARTDRAAAAALFRSRVLPAVGLIALISVIAGATLARAGLNALRTARLPEDDGAGVDDADPERRGAGLVGTLFVGAGVLLALLPLALFVAMMWASR